jgi:rubredoxin-NAD+ reductase
MDPIVIVGSGLAGYTLARELRKLDRESPLVMVSADDGSFYSKPNLSNALAAGKTPAQLVGASAEAMAQQLGAEILTQTRVTAIDPAGRKLRLSGGELRYSRLALALGADPIRLPLGGDAAEEVFSVNDLADYARLRERLDGRCRIAILGAGLIGCEFANDLATAGHAVEVIDIAMQPLGRLLPPEAGAMRQALADTGVGWHLGHTAQAVRRTASGLEIHFADGGTVGADLVLSAVGLRPRTGLARSAGLAINRGIVVDRLLETSAAGIYALGDCAEVESHVLPFVMPIMHAARTLAATLAGRPQPVSYPAMPVVVKTPALPAVVCPPAPGRAGTWSIEGDARNLSARFVDSDGTMLGFALTGDACSKRQAWVREMPPLLP